MSTHYAPGVPMAAGRSDISCLERKPAMLGTVLGNCTNTLPLKFDFHEGGISHYSVSGSTRPGMLAMSELLTTETPLHGGKPVVIDNRSSKDQQGEKE